MRYEVTVIIYRVSPDGTNKEFVLRTEETIDKNFSDYLDLFKKVIDKRDFHLGDLLHSYFKMEVIPQSNSSNEDEIDRVIKFYRFKVTDIENKIAEPYEIQRRYDK